MTACTHTHIRVSGFLERRVWNSAGVLMKGGVLSGHEGSSDGNQCRDFVAEREQPIPGLSSLMWHWQT